MIFTAEKTLHLRDFIITSIFSCFFVVFGWLQRIDFKWFFMDSHNPSHCTNIKASPCGFDVGDGDTKFMSPMTEHSLPSTKPAGADSCGMDPEIEKATSKVASMSARTTMARGERQIQSEQIRCLAQVLSRVPDIGGALRTSRFPEEFFLNCSLHYTMQILFLNTGVRKSTSLHDKMDPDKYKSNRLLAERNNLKLLSP